MYQIKYWEPEGLVVINKEEDCMIDPCVEEEDIKNLRFIFNWHAFVFNYNNINMFINFPSRCTTTIIIDLIYYHDESLNLSLIYSYFNS